MAPFGTLAVPAPADPRFTWYRPATMPSSHRAPLSWPRSCRASAPEGFDRSAFHREFDAGIVRFFREHLVNGAEAP
jgi:hypothetical protein